MDAEKGSDSGSPLGVGPPLRKNSFGDVDDTRPEFRVLVIRKMTHEDIHHELHMFFRNQNLVVLTTAAQVDDETYMGMFRVRARARDVDIDVEFLTRFRALLFLLFNDDDARVVMLPASASGVAAGCGGREMLRITLMAGSDIAILGKIIRAIQSNGLTIVQSECVLHHPVLVGGIAYFPYNGEYVIVAYAQAGPEELRVRNQSLAEFMTTADALVKEAIQSQSLLCSNVVIEPISYDPDPLRYSMHDEIDLDITDEWIKDESNDNAPLLFRALVVIDNKPSVRVVGVLKEILERTIEAFEETKFGIILCRQDHLPLAPQPRILAVVQCICGENHHMSKAEECLMRAQEIQMSLKRVLLRMNITGKISLDLLKGPPRSWKGLTFPPHVDQHHDSRDTMSNGAANTSFLDLYLPKSGMQSPSSARSLSPYRVPRSQVSASPPEKMDVANRASSAASAASSELHNDHKLSSPKNKVFNLVPLPPFWLVVSN